LYDFIVSTYIFDDTFAAGKPIDCAAIDFHKHQKHTKMDTKFQPTNETPLAALTIGQFKELIVTMVQPQQIIQTKQEFSTDTFGKKECSKLTGYSVNTINKMICEKKIPYYKKNAKVLFRRNEIEAWLLSNRVQTVEEFIEEKENQFCNGRSTR
jgi:excisionase family DNA binding protein